MLYATIDDFYLDDAQLEASPSRSDGVDSALEAQLRRYGCDVAQEACVQLRLPQGVAATAQVLLHRFYCKRSLRAFDIKPAAMAAFWLACKLEEVVEIDSPSKLRLRDVLSVFFRIVRRREGRDLAPLDPYSRQYEDIKAEVVRLERHMLRALGFIVHVEHPHRFVLTFGQLLGLGRDTLQEGWNLANDSMRTTLCVRHRAEVVACGVLFMAARRVGTPMPESPPWWELFGVGRDQLCQVCRELQDLLIALKAEYVALGRDVTSKAPPGQRTPLPAPSPATAQAQGAVAQAVAAQKTAMVGAQATARAMVQAMAALPVDDPATDQPASLQICSLLFSVSFRSLCALRVLLSYKEAD
jgi:cyclin L